jgi:cobalt/nickel transport system permease protein
MSNITSALYKIRYLDELSQKKTALNRLDPTVKLLVSLFFIVTVVSFGKYDFGGLLPMFVFPVGCIILGDLSYKEIGKRVLFAMPFVLGIGIFNPILDRTMITILPGFVVASGWISFFSLVVKSVLTVSTAVILIASTGIENIAHSLRKLKVPKIIVVVLLLTYRYISVLIEEAANIMTAYSLRAPGEKGIRKEVWGSLMGQLLMRTYDRGQKVYDAMIMRGFHGDFEIHKNKKIGAFDIVYFLGWIMVFVLFRLFNVPVLIEIFLKGVFS